MSARAARPRSQRHGGRPHDRRDRAGLLVLAGITADDGVEDRDWLVRKLVQLRIFDDDAGVMNRSVRRHAAATSSAVSQFTLYASTRKGNRPVVHGGGTAGGRASRRSPPSSRTLAAALGKPVPTGVFGAHMEVHLVNDGPVTIWLDSRVRD